MPRYFYRAFDGNGKIVSGFIKSGSKEEADIQVQKSGVVPIEIVQRKSLFTGWRLQDLLAFKAPHAKEMIIFTKQFQTMLRAGVKLLDILRVLRDQVQNRYLKNVVIELSQDIENGISLTDAFKKHPQVFNTLYCSVIYAGERSGSLAKVMDRLSYIMEHEYQTKSDIKSSMRYPFFVMIFLSFAFFILLFFVVPKFMRIFQARGIELPLPTRICMVIHHYMSEYWYIGTIFFVLAGILIFIGFQTERGRYYRDYILLRTPLLGPLIIKSAMSRFASIFSILKYSGVPILESMNILSGTIGNTVISREFDQIKEHIKKGRSISGLLMHSLYFTPMVISMVAVGEKTDRLETMLRDIAVHYDSEVAYTVNEVTAFLNPFLTIVMAVAVGFFAIAIFLPMWEMTSLAR